MTEDLARVAELEALLRDAQGYVEALIESLNEERRRSEAARQVVPTFGVLNPSSPSYPGWLDFLGDNACRLVSPYPDIDIMPDGPPRPVFVIDPGSIDRARFGRIVVGLAGIWGVSPAEASRQVEEDRGFRIPAREVFVCRDPGEGRDFWLAVATGRWVGKVHFRGEGAPGDG